MSVTTLNSYTRLSDSLEREILKSAENGHQAYPVLEGLAMVANAIGRGASAFGRYLVQVAEALNEARARDARFSGSQW
ncbi:MAG TPA: hypothetical protein VKY60_04940 [Burkholderiaceae bacterium]|jgi:hypothetical protein|nr:hypothetical protein [Burkholderiaceae bacterium]